MKLMFVIVSAFTILSLSGPQPWMGVSNADTSYDLNDLSALDLKSAFKALQDNRYVINPSLMEEAIVAAFGNRMHDAIDLACLQVRLPNQEKIEGRTINRAVDFFIAKSILQAFLDEALDKLTDLYDSTNDAVTRGNIVMVLGGMADDPRISVMLFDALEDRNTYGDIDAEAAGEPMRVCDLAYNQIVARFEVKDVLRTIGNGHSMEVRDSHINILKGLKLD